MSLLLIEVVSVTFPATCSRITENTTVTVRDGTVTYCDLVEK